MSEREHTPLTREEFVAVLSGEKTLAQVTRERDLALFRKQWLKKQGEKQNEYEAQFRTMPTRQLLKMRSYSDRERDDPMFVSAYDYALHKVLASRPHLPRGKEQTAIRKAKAKKHRGQGKSKNR